MGSISKFFIEQIKVPKNYILLFFAGIYCAISLVNHYNYRTYAFDLGIYNNCLYQYAHFHKNHYPYLHHLFSNFLADHFSLYTVILSPLYYIFGTYTLLLVQIASVLFGAIGIYKFIQRRFESPFLPEIAMFHYLSFFGIYSALAFDYHDNVVSAMLLPWFLYYFDAGKTRLTILFAILIVIGKENMPLWLGFVCLGLFLLNFKDKRKRNLSLILAFSSLIYTVLVIKVIMPALDPMVAQNGYNAFHYSVLGNNSSEIISNLLNDPAKIFNAFYLNPFIGRPHLNEIKKELYICLLFSGGFMLLFRPQYLIMLIPIIAQKVLHDDFGKWGITGHYSIEFTPIIIVCFYDGLAYVKQKQVRLFFAVAACISTIYITKDKMDSRYSEYYNKINTAIYIRGHYQCLYDRAEVKRVMKLIPKDANVSAFYVFAPHLSFRKNIYQYPDIHDAEYIMLANSPLSFPMSPFELDIKIKELLDSKDWETVSASKGIYLFKKRL
jgi:uncharacterized membrane protein